MSRLLLVLACSFSAILGAEESPLDTAREWFRAEQGSASRAAHIYGSLATVKKGSRPSSRIVSIFMSEDGPVFYTNRESWKVAHLQGNPAAAMNIWLAETNRQLSIEGEVAELARERTESAWRKMPRERQLRFIASAHRGPLKSQELLRERMEELSQKYEGDVPMPDSFVGFVLEPQELSFYEMKSGDFSEKVVSRLKGKRWVTKRHHP